MATGVLYRADERGKVSHILGVGLVCGIHTDTLYVP